MSWYHLASTADELRSGSFRAVFQVPIDGVWKKPSECGRTVSSGGINYIVGRPNLQYRVVLHNDHPSLYYLCDVEPDAAKAGRGEEEAEYAFRFADIPEAPQGPAGSRKPGAAEEAPGNLGKVLVTATESERYDTAAHTICFSASTPAASSAAPGVGVKKAQTKFGINTAAPAPSGHAAAHSETRAYGFRRLRELPQLAFEYRDEVALCIAGVLKSVPGAGAGGSSSGSSSSGGGSSSAAASAAASSSAFASSSLSGRLSGAKRSAAEAGLKAAYEAKPNIKPDLASLKQQAADARAARLAARSGGGDDDEDEEDDEDDDEEEEDAGAAGGRARREASQSVAIVSLLQDDEEEEGGRGKGGRRKRGKAGSRVAAALPRVEETRIVRVVAAGGVTKDIREVLVPVLPAGTGLGYSEGADGELCIDDDDEEEGGAALGAGAGAGSRSRSAKPGGQAAAAAASSASAGAGAGARAAAAAAAAAFPMPWYGLPHLLAAAQAALAAEDSHSGRLLALDAAKALAEAALLGPASTSSSSSSSSSSSTRTGAAAAPAGPAGRVWTHSGVPVTSIAQALSSGSGLPLVVAFGARPVFKPLQDIQTAV